MYISTLSLDPNHWSTQWVPISYNLKPHAASKSHTFLSHTPNIEDEEVNAIARAYYMSPEHIEIGDVWLNEVYRGRDRSRSTHTNKKYSHEFMTKVIAKIWRLYPNAKVISLVVASNNIAAIKLYKSLGFSPTSNPNPTNMNAKPAIYMTRHKRRT